MSATGVIAEAERLGIALIVADGRLRFRAPAGVMTEDIASRLRAAKPEIVALLGAGPEDRRGETPDSMGPNAPARHDLPRGCLAVTVCGVVGICGRPACIPEGQRAAWADAVAAARSPDNPHRVPDFDEPKGAAA